MKKILYSFFVFLLSFAAVAQVNPRLQRIDSLMNHFYSNGKFMGSVTIREKDNVIFEKAYGFADVQSKIVANTNTKYKIGSITKMFTASVIFQLIESKKITLATKLSAFYPEIKNAEKITISHLLGHQSGIYNYTNDASFKTYCTTPQTKKQMLSRIASYEPVFEPGEKAEYSNSNYVLLGYIIEDVTKKTYAKNVEDRITKKLKLKDTYYYSKINPANNEAYSYSYENNGWEKYEEWDDSVAFAAGALSSTPGDLTAFIKALFDGKIIKPESLEEMKKLESGYGKGIFAFSFGERRFYGHNGGIEGFVSSLGYYPKDELGIAIIANGANYDINAIAIGILSIYYKMPFPFPNLNFVTVSPEVLKTYEGTYASPGVPLKIGIKHTDGKLMAQATGQGAFELNAVSDNEFVYDAAGINMVFKENSLTLKQGGMVLLFTKE